MPHDAIHVCRASSLLSTATLAVIALQGSSPTALRLFAMTVVLGFTPQCHGRLHVTTVLGLLPPCSKSQPIVMEFVGVYPTTKRMVSRVDSLYFTLFASARLAFFRSTAKMGII